MHWDKTFFEEQKEAFKIQCDLALKFKFPVVVHCRESINETIELIKPYAGFGLRGVFHCFTGTVDQAHLIADLGFKLGMGGVATFKKGGLEPVVKEVGLEHFMLETDSPYLAPAPNRGKRNEPAYTAIVARKISEIKGMDIEEIGEVTSSNNLALFNP